MIGGSTVTWCVYHLFADVSGGDNPQFRPLQLDVSNHYKFACTSENDVRKLILLQLGCVYHLFADISEGDEQ